MFVRNLLRENDLHRMRLLADLIDVTMFLVDRIFMKKLAAAWLCLFSASVWAETTPKNIIFVISDGMGPAYTTGYRYFADDPATKEVEETVFDRLYVGSASTYPAPVSGYVTDSAAAATALSSGVKSYNGAIGVDADKQPVQTLLEKAKAAGYKTGVAVTSQINHATPAAFLTHNESRRNYNAIADSIFDQRVNGQFTADVMLGGGWLYFQRKDRDIVQQFKDAGYTYVDKIDQLPSVKQGSPLLGLFAEIGLPWALDYPQKRRLLPLAEAAVHQLENDKGFVLMIEASQVDWAGHANDVAAAMVEMADLSDTLEWLEAYVDSHPDTLLVVTADHSTGGLTLARDGEYIWSPEFIHTLDQSPKTIADELGKIDDAKKRAASAEKLLKVELTKDEKESLEAITAKDDKAFYAWVKHYIDLKTHTGWTTDGHTAVDVPVLAKGVAASKFAGNQDNTDLAKKLGSFIQ